MIKTKTKNKTKTKHANFINICNTWFKNESTFAYEVNKHMTLKIITVFCFTNISFIVLK